MTSPQSEDDQVWKPIPGWEDDYLVSDQGHIWSLIRDCPLFGSANDQGYIRVSLRGPDGRIEQKIHRLVMLAFEGPAPEGTEVCHIIRDQVRHGTHNTGSTRDHFKCGHPKTGIHVGARGNGKHFCRPCRNKRQRENRLKRKVE